MNRAVAFLTGLGVGAGAMYLLDPDRGKRRRALMRDQVTHLANCSGEAIEKNARDLRNRARGIIADTKARFTGEPVPDHKLVDRVKALLGRYPVHHRAITVAANSGTVTLSGETLAKELDTLIGAIKSVRGVTDIINNLTVHESAEGISSLQGEPIGARGATI